MRKTIHFTFYFICLFIAFSCTKKEPIVSEKAYNKGINITPVPLELTQSEGYYILNSRAVFVSENSETDKVANYFEYKILNATGYDLKVKKEKVKNNYINLQLVADMDVNDEGYKLEVTKNGVDIQAKTPQGLFYGMQTIMQLLPAEIESPLIVKNMLWKIPIVTIKDEPRFKYRGIHLDVSRHFVDVDFIKKQLDVLAMFKINKFHWHLTDDQGWRIEIKKYPKLMELAAKRTEGEGNTDGPNFYTQEQIKDVVAYAKERFIEVIPEIELPGHAVAAISAYPELSCTGKQIDVRNYWGVATDVFCVGNDSTFRFLEDVLTEVVPLFESDYIHIGGDECPKTRWEKCPKCQARIKELGLKAEKGHSKEEKLQSYAVQRIEKFLLKQNKKIIGWDEILEGGLAPSATVMSWRGEEGGIIAGNEGHDVIMTPMKWMYADKYQGDAKLLPVTIGGFLPLDTVYSYDPMPKQLAEDKKQHVLGLQMNFWCEYKYSPADVEHDMYPRIIAVSETGWSAKEKKDNKDFIRRIDNQRVRLDMHNINYYIPQPEQKGSPSCNFVAFVDSVTLEFKSTEPVKMVYTMDETEPTLTSQVYKNALTFTENTTLKIRSVLLSDKMSKTRTITIEKQVYALAQEKDKAAKSGLKVEYYKGVTRTVNELEGKTADEIGYIATPQDSKHVVPNYFEIYDGDFCSTVLTGYVNIPENGVYYFSTDSEMWLDNKQLITNATEEGRARRFSRSDKSIALAKGTHSFKLIRLGATFGGWPTQWEHPTVWIRKADEANFKIMDASYFK